MEERFDFETILTHEQYKQLFLQTFKRPDLKSGQVYHLLFNTNLFEDDNKELAFCVETNAVGNFIHDLKDVYNLDLDIICQIINNASQVTVRFYDDLDYLDVLDEMQKENDHIKYKYNYQANKNLYYIQTNERIHLDITENDEMPDMHKDDVYLGQIKIDEDEDTDLENKLDMFAELLSNSSSELSDYDVDWLSYDKLNTLSDYTDDEIYFFVEMFINSKTESGLYPSEFYVDSDLQIFVLELEKLYEFYNELEPVNPKELYMHNYELINDFYGFVLEYLTSKLQQLIVNVLADEHVNLNVSSNLEETLAQSLGFSAVNNLENYEDLTEEEIEELKQQVQDEDLVEVNFFLDREEFEQIQEFMATEKLSFDKAFIKYLEKTDI